MTSDESATASTSARSRTFARYLPVLVICSLVFGLTVGTAIRALPTSDDITIVIDAFDVVGTMWVNAIRMTVIPLIVPLLIASIAGARSGRDATRLGLATIVAFVLLVAVLAVVAALVAPLLFRGLHIDSPMTDALRTSIAGTTLPTGDASLGSWFKALIPTNPVKAAAEGSMLSIIVFAVAFGFATLAAPEAVRERVIVFSHSLSAIMLIVVQAVLLLAPIGIFALTPMLLALSLPVEGLAILIAVNPIVDRFTTIGNVAANMALTATLATLSRGKHELG